VTVRGSGIRIYTFGRADDAVREADFARFLLRRLADGRPVADPGQALAQAGRLLEKAVLGPAVAEIEGDSVVIVPPGRLTVVPWGLLPVLQGRSVGVSPSATVWLRVRSTPEPAHRAVALVGGPDLADAKAEVMGLSDLYSQATVLTNGMATVGRVLAALDGSWLAHVAAHGTFRADNPLFSSLQLDDGPLTGYDLEGMNRAPHRLVLSACESGRSAPIGSDELLGLASSLIPMGTVGIVAAVVPVSDQVTVPVMRSLHGRLAEGAGFPDALRQARADAAETGDPIVLATACSFVALGV
jgi:CHAT domain